MSGLVIPSQRTRPKELDPEDRVFRHRHRPKWGLGVWVREERTRRRLRFEDGELRAFKEGFYHMLVPVDSDKVDVDEVFERVMDEHREESSLPKATKPPVMSFDEQLAVFLKLFPDGFSGETFQTTYGSESDGKRSLANASKAMKQVGADLAPKDCFDAVLGVWRSSAIVTPRKLTALEGLKDEDKVMLGEALHGLLHDDSRFARRFDTWLEATRKPTAAFGWRSATAVLGLAKPQKHVVIRRRVLQLQAAIVRPTRIPSAPTLAGYRRGRRVMRATRDKLVGAGLKPKNLLDVYAFVWETLRPKGQEIARSL